MKQAFIITIALFFYFSVAHCMDDRLLHKKEGFLVVVMPGGNLVGNSRLKFPTLLGTSQPKNSIEVPGTTYTDIAPWAIFKNKNMYIEHHITFWIKKNFGLGKLGNSS